MHPHFLARFDECIGNGLMGVHFVFYVGSYVVTLTCRGENEHPTRQPVRVDPSLPTIDPSLWRAALHKKTVCPSTCYAVRRVGCRLSRAWSKGYGPGGFEEDHAGVPWRHAGAGITRCDGGSMTGPPQLNRQ